jgi:hypothetical protein
MVTDNDLYLLLARFSRLPSEVRQLQNTAIYSRIPQMLRLLALLQSRTP